MNKSLMDHNNEIFLNDLKLSYFVSSLIMIQFGKLCNLFDLKCFTRGQVL